MQSTSLDPFIGRNIGIYYVERLLGRGRVNAVYLAYHSIQNRPVALLTSILPETFSFEARRRFQERFRQEAAKLTSLRHAHLLPVHDYGEHAGYCYLVTPYMTNGSLADMFQRRGRLHYADVLDILRQITAGLAYAHGKRFFHGALKPSNIVFNDQQGILVAGFGLTQILQMRGVEQDRRPYGHLFSIAGTLLTPTEYIAPEIVQGQAADARTDIYSLGAILFELLCGQPPFTGENPLEVATQHVQRSVPSLRTYCPDVPLALAAVVHQALDHDAARRFQRVEELAEAFAEVCTARPRNGTSEVGRTVQNTKLQETPPAGYALGNWQLRPPVITDRVAAVKPTSEETNSQAVARSAFLTQFSPASASDPEPVATAKSRQEAVYDLWTFSPQGSPPHANVAQKNASSTAQRTKSDQHSRPFKRRKASNERISRRMVVALLVTGGVAVAGTAVAIGMAVNPTNQQAQNNVADLAKNAALNFTNPTDGKANVVVHLPNGNFVAYDRTCTHKSVYVQYDPKTQLLVCPAHGATFDPAHEGAVVQGPATKPLSKVTIHINADGTITA